MVASFARVDRLEKAMNKCLVLMKPPSGMTQADVIQFVNVRVSAWLLVRKEVVLIDVRIEPVEECTTNNHEELVGISLEVESVEIARKLGESIAKTSNFTLTAVYAQHSGPR